MRKLPHNWVKTTIGEVYSFVGGGTPSKAVADYWNGDIPWASIKDISQVNVLSETQDYITEAGLTNSAANIADIGDVVLGTRMLPGKAVLTSIKTAINQDLKIVRPRFPIPAKFTIYQFEYLRNEFVSRSGGTTVQGIKIESINEIPFLLPPTSEQKRIVAKLDTLFGHLDQLKARLENIPVLLKQFRQSVLTQAVTGKLTEEWRGANSNKSTQILSQVEVGREKALINSTNKRNTALKGLITNVDPTIDVPNDWAWTTLASICDPTRALTYGVIKLGGEVEFGVPCLRTSDVRPLKVLTGNIKKISKEIADAYPRTYLRGGEVLINVRGTLGGVAVASQEFRGYNVSREIAVAPVLPILNSLYLAFYIASKSTQNWLTGIAKGIAYTGINIEDLINLPVPLPSREEQDEIVRIVASLFALADRTEARIRSLQEQIDQLPQAILAKAFRGELVKGTTTHPGKSIEKVVEKSL